MRESCETMQERIDNMDFLGNADNLYLTDEFIVKQTFTFLDSDLFSSILVSEDTYYARTPKRDSDFEFICKLRDVNTPGKRVHASCYRRSYVD